MPPGKSPVTGVVPWIGAALLLAAGGLLVWRAAVADSNHVGFDVRQAWLPSGLAFLWGLMGLLRPGGNRRASVALIGVSVLLAALVLVLDQFNLLVQYDRWIERGMPERWRF